MKPRVYKGTPIKLPIKNHYPTYDDKNIQTECKTSSVSTQTESEIKSLDHNHALITIHKAK